MLFNHLSENEVLKWNGEEYLNKNGILREKNIYTQSQEQTKDCFSYKWNRRDTYESSSVKNMAAAWLKEKYFMEGGEEEFWNHIVPAGCKILDAGCGAALSAMALFGERINQMEYLGADISSAVDVAKKRFEEAGFHGEFIQCDLNHLPIKEESLDVIFSEGVLHHTDSTGNAIKNLSKLLCQSGRFLFYVYAKKGPVREFTDDYIRNYFSGMSDEETWNGLYPLTKLGETLGKLDMEIEIEEAVPYLGIPAGKMNLQRFFYWYICKAFYRPEYSLDEMNHLNFDWFRPQNCQRQTPEELEQWCEEAGLVIKSMNVEEAGITVVAVKE